MQPVMADDPQDLAAKVAHLQSKLPLARHLLESILASLSGIVNQAKNRTASESQPSYSYQASSRVSRTYAPSFKHVADNAHAYPYPSRGYRGSRVSRFGYRGRGGRATVYRNNTLVLNGATAPQDTTAEIKSPSTNDLNAKWTTKPTRQSLQLIKGDVFEKVHAQSREQTRKQKLKIKEQREQARIEKELQQLNTRSVLIHGIRFQVMSRGKKLCRLPGESLTLVMSFFESLIDLQCTGGDHAKSTPKTVMIAGVKFIRSRSGHLFRDSSLRLFRCGFQMVSPGPGSHTAFTN